MKGKIRGGKSEGVKDKRKRGTEERKWGKEWKNEAIVKKKEW